MCDYPCREVDGALRGGLAYCRPIAALERRTNLSVESSALSVERSPKARSPIHELDYAVKYSQLFEATREEAEVAGVLQNPRRNVIRSLILKGLFTRPRLLRFTGRLLWLYRASGAQNLFRLLHLNKMLPYRYRE